MANEIMKEIKTRIALRTGDYAYWTTGAGKDIELLKGEVCVCTVAVTDNQAQTAPTVLLKICDATGKKFGDLKWTSALAADVYEWAKAANVVFENEHILFKNTDGGTIKDLDLSVFVTATELATELAKYYTKTEINNLFGQVVNTVTTVSKGTGINVTDAGTAGNHAYTVALDVEGAKTALGLQSAAYETVDNLNATAKGYADAVEAKLPTSADYGVLGVAAGDDTITVGGTAQNPTIAVAANKFDAQGAAAQALADAKAYADAKPHENTAHTHSVGTGLKKTGDGGIDGDVKYELNLKFGELNNNKLQLLDAANNVVVAEFDAAAFVEDSYLNEVTYKDENGDNVLEFTFTLNDGSTKTVDVDLSHLVDVYTADETTITLTTSGSGKVFKVKEAGIETKHIKDGNVTEAKLEKNVTDALALARTAIQDHQDITGKADKVAGAINGNFAGLDANGNLVDSGKKAGDFDVAGAAATAKQEAIAAAAKDAGDKAAVVLG